MKIHCKYTGVKGFVTVYNDAVRYAYMITAEAKRRLKILEHWKNHGLQSAIDAFEVSERTLWDWKGRLDKGGGKLVLLATRKIFCLKLILTLSAIYIFMHRGSVC